MLVKIEVHYKLGHSYKEEWSQTTNYCPDCGARGVWAEEGPGDYYLGASYLCIACGASGFGWYGNTPFDGEQCDLDEQRRKAIIEATEKEES